MVWGVKFDVDSIALSFAQPIVFSKAVVAFPAQSARLWLIRCAQSHTKLLLLVAMDCPFFRFDKQVAELRWVFQHKYLNSIELKRLSEV